MYKSMQTRPKFEGKYSELSERILQVFFAVHHELGYGFSERIYQGALGIALREAGFQIEEQKPIPVSFRGQQIGEYFADIVVDGLIILELKSARQIIDEHEAQLLNYLKASEIEVGYVLNFGPVARFARKIYDNDKKGTRSWVKRK